MSDGSEQAKGIVQQFFDARSAGDAEALAALLSADVVWVPPPSLRSPVEGVENVSDRLVNGVAAATLNNVQRRILHMVAEGDVVVTRQRFLSETRGGERYDNEYVWMFYLSGGRISRIEEYTDTFHAALTMGMAQRL
ncbi:MAG: nuclear transport factor 2 family protein [Arenicella sp.]|nr:nuclear transport factor 2 family protein [Arenicella sp.]